jgi:hypothetical protein
MNRRDILTTATEYVTKDRAATHGDAERNFQTIAALWTAYIGHSLTAVDVAAMMMMLKLARIKGNPANADNWIDAAGYAACGGEIATATNTPNEGIAVEEHIAKREAERAAFEKGTA